MISYHSLLLSTTVLRWYMDYVLVLEIRIGQPLIESKFPSKFVLTSLLVG